MKRFLTGLIFLSISFSGYGQKASIIEYPFSTDNKFFIELRKSSTGMSYDKLIVVSFDGKYGVWFIAKTDVHIYNLIKNEWELYNKDNGLFNGKVGVIFHDSNNYTWLGSQRDPFFDGFGAIGAYAGGVSMYNGERLTLYEKQEIETRSPEIIEIGEGPSGEILVATGDPSAKGFEGMYPGGLFMYKDNEWYDFSKGKSKCPIKYISHFYNDSENNIWLTRRYVHYRPSICYYDGNEFVEPKLKKGMLYSAAFTSSNTWIAYGKYFYKYNYSTKAFDILGNCEPITIYDPIILGEDLVCFYTASDKVFSTLSAKKRTRMFNERSIQIIDKGKIINSKNQSATMGLFFKTYAKIDDNMILFGTNNGIVNYSNGKFQRLESCNLLDDKNIIRIIILEDKKVFMASKDSEAYVLDGKLTEIDLPDNSAPFNFVKNTSKGDVVWATEKDVFLIKTSEDNEVVKLIGDLNNCSMIYELDNKLLLICDDGIIPFGI